MAFSNYSTRKDSGKLFELSYDKIKEQDDKSEDASYVVSNDQKLLTI